MVSFLETSCRMILEGERARSNKGKKHGDRTSHRGTPAADQRIALDIGKREAD